MKQTIILASVAIAALFAFSSCQKEELQDKGSANDARIITAEFEKTTTKTTLNADGKTPEWAVGDKIKLLNSDAFQEIEIISGSGSPASGKAYISGKGITIGTTLTGTLYAVYPASATTLESCADGKVTFTIPAIQSGTFAGANICVAKSSTTDEVNLVFRNATAVLEFSQTASTTKVLSIRVEAANPITGPMAVEFKEDGTLDTPTSTSLSGKRINVRPAEAKDKFYIAVAPVTTGKVEFEYQQAVKVATVTTEAGKTLRANIIYACPSMDGKTYEVKKGSINGKDYVQVGAVKWGTMNLGALSPTGFGNYYTWGNVTALEDPKNTLNWEQDVFGKTFNKVSQNTACPGGILAPEYDAAYHENNAWRMPTQPEFKAIKDATYWAWDSSDQGYYLYNPQEGDEGKINDKKADGHAYDKSDALLFFPAAGYGIDSKFVNSGSYGNYWSSTLASTTTKGKNLNFKNSSVNTADTSERCSRSFTIRPVTD